MRNGAATTSAGSARLTREQAVLWRTVSDGVLVLGRHRRNALLLQGAGALVWDLLARPMAEDDLVAVLTGAYDASPDAVAPHVRSLLNELGVRNLVVEGGAPPAVDGDDDGPAFWPQPMQEGAARGTAGEAGAQASGLPPPGADFAPSVAAYGLRGTRLTMPEQPLPPDAWAAFLRRIDDQRVLGFLVLAIEEGAFAATQEQWDQAAAGHLQSMRVALALEQLLLDVVDVFAARGIDYRVLKGSACAQLDYADPALRSFGDVDILVPTDQYDLAVEALRRVYAHRRVLELRPGFDRRFGKGGSFLTARGLEIDLHRLFVSGPLGLSMRLDDLFATSSPFTIGAVELKALDRELRFLHACFHAALGSSGPLPRLLALRDVAQMLLGSAPDTRRVHELAAAWRAQAVVAQAVRWAWDTLDLADIVPLSAWAAGYRADRGERANLAAYEAGVRYSVQAAAAVSSIPGISNKAAYVLALALPEPPYRRRALRSVRGLFTGSRPARATPGGP